MNYTGVDVALIGRNCKCKKYFLRAASTAELLHDTLDAHVWWTASFGPTRADFVQTPEHGFSPSGDRLLPAKLRYLSATDVTEMEKEQRGPILLVMSADVVFQKGIPRAGDGDGTSCIHVAASRTRERLGRQVPFAIAVSVDIEEIGKNQVASKVKEFLASVKDDLAIDGVPIVAVSPWTELWLQEQVREGGRVSYLTGDKHFRATQLRAEMDAIAENGNIKRIPEIPSAFEIMMNRKDVTKARAAFDICGGTGIMAAVSAAVGLTPPTLVFPIGDFASLQSSGWDGEGSPPSQLRTCRILRAGSTARDVFSMEKRNGIYSGGDVTGAEVMPTSVDAAARAEPASIELDAPIGAGAWLMRLSSSRKAVKVWKVGLEAAGSGAKAGRPLASVQFGDLRSKERRRGRS